MHEAYNEATGRRIWLEGKGQRAHIELRGALPVRWCSRLTGHLAAQGVGVGSIVAHRDTGGRWHGSVEVTGRLDRDDAEALGKLLDREVPWSPPRTALLTQLDVDSSREHGGTVLVHFRAPDRVGLLASVFDSLSMQTLFPAAIEVHTRNGVADDRLWLRGLGNAALGGPADEARVREALGALVESRPG